MTDAGGRALARAAEGLLGTPFRLHGRDPARGLDCVGLVLAALARTGRPAALSCDYGLRNRDHTAFYPAFAALGFEVVSGACWPGDIYMVRTGPAQVHLALALGSDAFVHAHAGLGRVVRTPAPLCWPAVGQWRLRE